MESEKVKEIKKALECMNGVCKDATTRICWNCEVGKKFNDETACKEALTLINELESENKRLSKENFVLYRDRFTKKELDDISACRVAKATKELKDRIAELEEGIAKSMLGCEFLPECTNDKLKQFTKDVLKFVKEYAFKDSKEIYTNGATLVPLFRVEYALKTGGQDYQQG